MDHPIFEPFGKPHSGTFSSTKFYSYSRVLPESAAEVLARFDNGDPALVSMKIDNGRVLLFTSSADISRNDLPLKAVYAPFWQQMLRYLASFEEDRHWLNIGDVLEPKRFLLKNPQAQSGTLDPDEVVVVLDPMKQRVEMMPGSEGFVTESAGFYEIRTSNLKSSAAVNTLPKESDLTHHGAEEMTAGWISSQPAAFSQAESPDSRDDQSRHQRFWGLLLLAGLLFLISESFLSNERLQGVDDGKQGSTIPNP
jgi:hypothetical protein